MEGRAGLLGDMEVVLEDFVHLARVALADSPTAPRLLRKYARRYRATHPALADALVSLLRESPVRSATTASPVAVTDPVDTESRLPLVRREFPVVLADEPIFTTDVRLALEQLVSEHKAPGRLSEVGLAPTRTALFVGPPGVGKTLAARWIASRLDEPLVTLDLASVMSSLLGRTGGNVRRVLDYARQTPCVLLLDELDAVAKRRDDVTEIGELKRLVTVLLQEIDAWPEGSLLLAATNHDELLDPAVWRRFELVVKFPLPGRHELEEAIRQFLDLGPEQGTPSNVAAILPAFEGFSYSDIERDVMRARRGAATTGAPVEQLLAKQASDRIRRLPLAARVSLAVSLTQNLHISQREANELTGVSRDTLRKVLRSDQQSEEPDA